MENSTSSCAPEEQRLYTLFNGGNFNAQHLNEARKALGLVGEGGIIFDGQLVRGDRHDRTARGELILTRELSETELATLSALGMRAIEGATPLAA